MEISEMNRVEVPTQITFFIIELLHVESSYFGPILFSGLWYDQY